MNSSAIGKPAWLVPARVDAPELLDMGAGSRDDVRATLAEMHHINRYLGGLRAITHHLYPRLLAAQAPVTLVDLGCGGAEFMLTVQHWARGQGRSLHFIGLDYSRRNLDAASDNLRGCADIRLLQADATCLPFGRGQVDYLLSSLFLHHFTPDQVVNLLRSAFAVARRGIIMSDLVRGWLPLVGFRLGQPVFARNYLTRNDGEVSVRRAYTPGELQTLAREAGLTSARVYTHFPWRMTLVADR